MTGEQVYWLVDAAYEATKRLSRETDKRSIVTVNIDATVAVRSLTESLHCEMGGQFQVARLARAYGRVSAVFAAARDDYERTYAAQAAKAVLTALVAAAALNERTEKPEDDRVVAYHPLKR